MDRLINNGIIIIERLINNNLWAQENADLVNNALLLLLHVVSLHTFLKEQTGIQLIEACLV